MGRATGEPGAIPGWGQEELRGDPEEEPGGEADFVRVDAVQSVALKGVGDRSPRQPGAPKESGGGIR